MNGPTRRFWGSNPKRLDNPYPWRHGIPSLARGVRTSGGIPLTLGVLTLTAPLTAGATDYRHQFIPFAQVTAHYRDQAIGDQGYNDRQPGINLFYTADAGSARMLTEYFLAGGKTTKLQRFQLGWSLHPGIPLFVGRFHRPLGQWHIRYHHGTYIQTTAQRPRLIELENHGGPLPTPTIGLLLEEERWLGINALDYMLSVGAGPMLNDGRLLLMDLLRPNRGEQEGWSVSTRLAYATYQRSLAKLGLFARSTHIPASDELAHVKQTVLRLYGNRAHGPTPLLASVFVVDNQLDYGERREQAPFIGGYTHQWARLLTAEWALYGRLAPVPAGDSDAYLNRIRGFAHEVETAGLRYELSRDQALKMELEHQERLDEPPNQVTRQWSAAFL